MAHQTAIAYCIMLMLSPVPNLTIASYLNKKPLLTKARIQKHTHTHTHTYIYNISKLIFINMILTAEF